MKTRWLAIAISVSALATPCFGDTSPPASKASRLLQAFTKPMVDFSKQTGDYFRSVRSEGAKRLFLKSSTAEKSNTKAFLLTPKKNICLHIFNPETPFQLPSRAIGKMLFGKAYDFVPIAAMTAWFEKWLTGFSRNKALQFTKPVRTLLAVASFPLTGFGILTDSIIVAEQSEKKFESLEYVVQFDYRYKSAADLADFEMSELAQHPEDSTEFKLSTGLSSLSPERIRIFNIAVLSQHRATLTDFLRTTSELGFAYNDPIILGALAGDSADSRKLAEKMAKRSVQNNIDSIAAEDVVSTETDLSDAFQLQIQNTSVTLSKSMFYDANHFTSGEWLANAGQNYIIPEKSIASREQRNKVFQLQIELAQTIESVYKRSCLQGRAKICVMNFLDIDDKDIMVNTFSTHLRDAFITDTLPNFLSKNGIDSKLLPYFASNYLEWVAKLEMMSILNIKKLSYRYQNGTRVLTDIPLTIGQIENEILRDTTSSKNLPNLSKEFEAWKARVSAP